MFIFWTFTMKCLADENKLIFNSVVKKIFTTENNGNNLNFVISFLIYFFML